MNQKPCKLGAPWTKAPTLSETITDADGGLVATVWGKTREQQLKRLYLIKEAPRMQEALRELVKAVTMFDGGPLCHDAIDKAEAALREAEPV